MSPSVSVRHSVRSFVFTIFIALTPPWERQPVVTVFVVVACILAKQLPLSRTVRGTFARASTKSTSLPLSGSFSPQPPKNLEDIPTVNTLLFPIQVAPILILLPRLRRLICTTGGTMVLLPVSPANFVLITVTVLPPSRIHRPSLRLAKTSTSLAYSSNTRKRRPPHTQAFREPRKRPVLTPGHFERPIRPEIAPTKLDIWD